VEDEFLIAMDLSDILEQAGYEVLGPVATVGTALNLLTVQRPDACLLDVNLRNENSAPLAERLKVEKVPFLLSSAYGAETLAQYAAFRGITNIGKPAPAHLPTLIANLLKMHCIEREDDQI